MENDIIAAATNLSGDAGCALRWYRDEPIPAYGGRTAQDLVAEGHGHAVLAFLKGLENGATG